MSIALRKYVMFSAICIELSRCVDQTKDILQKVIEKTISDVTLLTSRKQLRCSELTVVRLTVLVFIVHVSVLQCMEVCVCVLSTT